MRFKLLRVATGLALAVACDGSSPSDGGGACTPSATQVCMSAGNKFEPATLTVPPGATVRWTNADGLIHTVTSATGSIDTFNSGDVVSGASFSRTFNSLGTVRYYCTRHGQNGTPPIGMSGIVTVKQ